MQPSHLHAIGTLQSTSLGVYLKNIFGPLLHEVPTIMTLGRVGIVHLPYYHAVLLIF